jgi:long-chain acyl-CoA synthetase
MSSDRLASDDPTGPPTLAPQPHQKSQPNSWIFDVDGCLIDSLTGTSLRPGARHILEHLATANRRVILWSAGGDSYARGRAEQFGVAGLIDGFFAKDGRGADGCYLTAHLPLHHPRVRAVFVDDRPEDLAHTLDVIAVSPYLSDDPFDRGLDEVARRAGLAGFIDRK